MRWCYRYPAIWGLFAVLATGLVDLACPSLAGGAEPQRVPFRVTARPLTGKAPLTVRITIDVPVHADTVKVCLVITATRSDRLCMPHRAGQQDMKFTLPAGAYAFHAEMQGATTNVVEVTVK